MPTYNSAFLGMLRNALRSVLSGTTPSPLGASGAVGTSTKAARADHVHALPTPAEIGAATSAALTAHEAAPDPHPGYVLESREGAANGVATLDATTRLPTAQLPDRTKDLGPWTVTVVAGDSPYERVRVHSAIEITGVAVTPIDTALGGAAATLSVTNVTAGNEVLSAATVAISGAAGTRQVLTLSANVDIAAGSDLDLDLVFPSGTTGGGVVVELMYKER